MTKDLSYNNVRQTMFLTNMYFRSVKLLTSHFFDYCFYRSVSIDSSEMANFLICEIVSERLDLLEVAGNFNSKIDSKI